MIKRLKQEEMPAVNVQEEEEDERFLGSGMSAQQQEIWDVVDAGEQAPGTIDPTTLKKLVLKFERVLTKNQELRVKYPNEPRKFIESEADLDEEIKNLTTLSSAPELYPLVISLGTLDSVLSLMAHENTDIVIAALGLLSEWTDEDAVTQGSQSGMLGIEALAKGLVRDFHNLINSWKGKYSKQLYKIYQGSMNHKQMIVKASFIRSVSLRIYFRLIPRSRRPLFLKHFFSPGYYKELMPNQNSIQLVNTRPSSWRFWCKNRNPTVSSFSKKEAWIISFSFYQNTERKIPWKKTRLK